MIGKLRICCYLFNEILVSNHHTSLFLSLTLATSANASTTASSGKFLSFCCSTLAFSCLRSSVAFNYYWIFVM